MPPGPKPLSPDEAAHNVSLEPVWFVDDVILDQKRNLSINTHQPSDPYAWHTVLTLEEPWEVGHGCYTDARAVIHDEGKFKLFYDLRGCNEVMQTDPALGFEWSVTCLAESTDGITFTKPTLGLVNFRNSSANNLVALMGNTSSEVPKISVCMFCSSVFVDPHGGPDGRLKSCAKDHRPGNFLTCVQSGTGFTGGRSRPSTLAPLTHRLWYTLILSPSCTICSRASGSILRRASFSPLAAITRFARTAA